MIYISERKVSKNQERKDGENVFGTNKSLELNSRDLNILGDILREKIMTLANIGYKLETKDDRGNDVKSE